MQLVATNTKTTIKQINWLIFCIVVCYCSTLEERVVDEYEPLCKGYFSIVVILSYIYVDRPLTRNLREKISQKLEVIDCVLV